MCLGIPMKVERIDGTSAEVSVRGVIRQADLSLVGEAVEVGDYVLVHVGFAIAKVDEEEVRRTWELLDELLEQDSGAADA